MKTYKQGQRVKVRLENDFHNTIAIVVGTIVRFEGDYWIIEIPIKARARAEKKLCPFSDCKCPKITSVALYISRLVPVILTY